MAGQYLLKIKDNNKPSAYTSKKNEHAQIQFEICGQEHEQYKICILPDGHDLDENRCMGSWIDIHHWVHPKCTIVGVPHPSHLVVE